MFQQIIIVTVYFCDGINNLNVKIKTILNVYKDKCGS